MAIITRASQSISTEKFTILDNCIFLIIFMNTPVIHTSDRYRVLKRICIAISLENNLYYPFVPFVFFIVHCELKMFSNVHVTALYLKHSE